MSTSTGYGLYIDVLTGDWKIRTPPTIGNFCWMPFRCVPAHQLWPILERADEEGSRFSATEIRAELMRRQARGEPIFDGETEAV